MSVVVVRYINEATEQSFILAQDADGDANTLHDAFEEYLVDGWITEILAYHRSADELDYEDWLQLERREEEAHAWDLGHKEKKHD